MFYHKIPWFYQDFKSENCVFFKSVLLSRHANTGLVTRDHAVFPNEERNTFTILNTFSLYQSRYNISII